MRFFKRENYGVVQQLWAIIEKKEENEFLTWFLNGYVSECPLPISWEKETKEIFYREFFILAHLNGVLSKEEVIIPVIVNEDLNQ